jgi:hypothetical protein
VRSVRRAVVAVGVTAILVALPSVAGAALPPPGSTAASDDVTVPVIAPGTSVIDAISWLDAAAAVRATEIASLLTSVNAAPDLSTATRSSLLALITTDQSAIAQLAAVAPTSTTLADVRQAVTKTIQLHVFSVLEPLVNEELAAVSIRDSAVALLALESSIRTAIAAAKSAGLPVGNASAEVRIFHADLTQAKALVVAIPASLRSIGTRAGSKTSGKLTAAATAEATAAVLVAEAKSAEQSIVTSLASKLRSQRRAG